MSRLKNVYKSFCRANSVWLLIRNQFKPGTLSHVEAENMDNAMSAIGEALEPFSVGPSKTAEQWNDMPIADTVKCDADEVLMHFDSTFDELYETVKGRAAHLLVEHLHKERTRDGDAILFGEAIVLASVDAFQETSSAIRECLDDQKVESIRAGGQGGAVHPDKDPSPSPEEKP